MEPIVIYVNIICGDIIGSAIVQGGKDNIIDYSLSKITPAVAEAMRVALDRVDGNGT